jgi:hypothetical protein
MVVILVSIPIAQLFATLPGMAVTIQQVMPMEARPGDVVTAMGHGLDAMHVSELYLIDDRQVSYRVRILEQMDAAISFKVPANVPAGQVRLAVKVTGRVGLVEQTVYLTIL